MDNIQSQFAEKILAGAEMHPRAAGSAFAPSNIALCKYWGKRDPALNLPLNSSLSISLGTLGTRTQIRPCEKSDRVYLNGTLQPGESDFSRRISAFLDLFRSALGNSRFEVRTENTIPTAAGLASSASGFAALIMALNELAGWGLDGRTLSMLARLGSGSAARSVFNGFVQWYAGVRADGLDSFAEPIDQEWPELRIGVLELVSTPKAVGSRAGMNRTLETSTLYKSWPLQAASDLVLLQTAIDEHDFTLLGKTAERNALAMHATMLSAWPPLLYLCPESVEQIHKIHRLRAEGLELFLTIDAGPNIKLLFLRENEADVSNAFPSAQIIGPFER